MFKRKRILAIIMSLMMVVSILPGTIFAADTSTAVNYVSAADFQTLDDYQGKQGGSSNIRIYMFHGGENESSGDAVYANNYGCNWTIRTNNQETAYWDNYIKETPDVCEDIAFAFFASGSQTAGTTDSNYTTNLQPYLKLTNADGITVMTGQELFVEAHDAGFGGSGGGQGTGPARGFDVQLKIPAQTLEAGKIYTLVIGSGLSGKKTDTLLDKDVCFTFSTAIDPNNPTEPSNPTGPVLCEKILLDSNMTLTKGEEGVLTATVYPENTENKNIGWASSDDRVALVDSNGKVTAIGVGIATITVSSRDGSNVKATCQVEVRAASTSGSGSEITTPSQTTPVPGAVTAAAKSNSYNSVKITWKKAANASGYIVYRYNSKTKKYVSVKNTTALSYTDQKLTCGKKYVYRVRAYRTANGKKVYGAYSAKTTTAPKPAVPKMKTSVKKGKVTVKWSKVSGATKYQVYKASKKNGKYSRVKTTSKKSITDRKVKKGKTYYYKMRAYRVVSGKKIYSSFSNPIKVKAK